MIYDTIAVILTCAGFFLFGLQLGLNKRQDKNVSLRRYEKQLHRAIENLKDSDEFQKLSDKEKQTKINELVLEYELKVANEFEEDL